MEQKSHVLHLMQRGDFCLVEDEEYKISIVGQKAMFNPPLKCAWIIQQTGYLLGKENNKGKKTQITGIQGTTILW